MNSEQEELTPTTQVVYEDSRPVVVCKSAVLRVVSGGDDGASCPLELNRVRIGTASDNDLVLKDVAISRHHIEFQVRDHGYLARDLDSTNGTFFRGAQVREVFVGPGAELRLGKNTVLRVERADVSRVMSAKKAFGTLIGNSRPMQDVFGLLSAMAPTDMTVLIYGETGTGKELVAEELHRQSARRSNNLIVVDCGSIPENLIESELFGHVKGAFTGALTDRPGVFEKASGGTVFLDEIGELPLAMQTRLLRVLDKRTVKRVGSHQQRDIDIRVVAATHRDLRQLVREKLFREDLYYRLSVVRVELPPLRDRPDDILLLARHFLWQSGCQDPDTVLTSEVLDALRSRSWPGNVRELRNVLERAIVLADGSRLALGEPTNLHPRSMEGATPSEEDPAVGDPGGEPWRPTDGWLARAMPKEMLGKDYKTAKEILLRQFEVLYLGNLIQLHGQNITRIAAAANVDRQLVRKLMRKHGLQDG